MSVVNRMLQDIDRRMGEGGARAADAHPDIRTVAARARRVAPSTSWTALCGIAIAAAAAIYALGLLAPAARHEPPRIVMPATAPAPAPGAAPPREAQGAPAAEVAAAPSAPGIAPAPAAREPVAAPAAVVEPAPERAERPATKASARSAEEAFRLSRTLSAEPAMAPRAAPAPRGEVRRTEIPVRRVAAEETVAAALALWNDGARGDALATLREALAAAEAARAPAAARLARELARLELAADQPPAALELLRRMEASLAGDADAWALRGNAAQRLSLHGESARAYLAALRLRPEEGKWMLGAAISLAAEGRVEEARPWVENARQRGAVTPAISAYLEQVGLGARR